MKLFFHDRNRGKGAALRTGFGHVTGEIVAIQDADLEYDPNEFAEMIKPIREGVADVVYGSRLSGGKPQRVHLFWHRMGNGFLTFLTDLLYNTTLSDMETCYKMFRKEVLETIRIESDDFSVEPELTAKICKNKQWRIYEIPISYYGRSYAEGKKISWRHGFPPSGPSEIPLYDWTVLGSYVIHGLIGLASCMREVIMLQQVGANFESMLGFTEISSDRIRDTGMPTFTTRVKKDKR